MYKAQAMTFHKPPCSYSAHESRAKFKWSAISSFFERYKPAWLREKSDRFSGICFLFVTPSDRQPRRHERAPTHFRLCSDTKYHSNIHSYWTQNKVDLFLAHKRRAQRFVFSRLLSFCFLQAFVETLSFVSSYYSWSQFVFFFV